jgi:hypothetical protein
MTTALVTWLCNTLVPGAPSDFVRNKYLPALGNQVSKFNLTFSQSVGVAAKFAGVLVKIGWAFVW